jgi:hypothetical protein
MKKGKTHVGRARGRAARSLGGGATACQISFALPKSTSLWGPHDVVASSFSLRSSGNQTDLRTRRRSRVGGRRQGAVAVAVRRRRASCAHRRAWNLSRLGTATEAGRSPASASARPGARRAANVSGRQISPGLDCDEIGEVADLGLDTN